mmetsp:Transcript_45557/g.116546  ORF Transcript_45557/g.116546 Transcript_45557/m.116546 type:complete len:273 (-) Transcript_45557:330-1148(-)
MRHCSGVTWVHSSRHVSMSSPMMNCMFSARFASKSAWSGARRLMAQMPSSALRCSPTLASFTRKLSEKRFSTVCANESWFMMRCSTGVGRSRCSSFHISSMLWSVFCFSSSSSTSDSLSGFTTSRSGRRLCLSATRRSLGRASSGPSMVAAPGTQLNRPPTAAPRSSHWNRCGSSSTASACTTSESVKRRRSRLMNSIGVTAAAAPAARRLAMLDPIFVNSRKSSLSTACSRGFSTRSSSALAVLILSHSMRVLSSPFRSAAPSVVSFRSCR